MQDTYKEVIIVLIVGSIVPLVLASIIVFIVLFYQKKRFRHQRQLIEMQSSIQQELLKTQLETQEATFRQISEELHDNVGQLLSSTKILLVITERSLAEVPQSLGTAITTLSTAIQDLRDLSKALNNEWLQRFNLVDNLMLEAERINVSRTVTVTVEASVKELPLKPEAQVMLFRVIQEALQNGIKHSEASCIGITLDREDPQILISIKDNGKGLVMETAEGNGVGLINMKNRTRLLSGTIDWQSPAGGGTNVLISIPTQNQHV